MLKSLAEFHVRRRESCEICFLPRPVRDRKHFARSERRIVRYKRTTEAQSEAKLSRKVAKPLFRQSQGPEPLGSGPCRIHGDSRFAGRFAPAAFRGVPLPRREKRCPCPGGKRIQLPLPQRRRNVPGPFPAPGRGRKMENADKAPGEQTGSGRYLLRKKEGNLKILPILHINLQKLPAYEGHTSKIPQSPQIFLRVFHKKKVDLFQEKRIPARKSREKVSKNRKACKEEMESCTCKEIIWKKALKNERYSCIICT